MEKIEAKNIEEIKSKIWEMANNLRGTMDASEYKNYILAFMFYRYLSDNQFEEMAKVDSNFAKENRNEYYKQQVAEMDDIRSVVSSSLGYFIEPEYTWESITDLINNAEMIPEYYQNLLSSFENNININENAIDDFKGLFNDVNLTDSRLGSNSNIRTKALNNIVELISSIDLFSEDGHDVLGDIYEYLIGQFAANAGKKGGEFYTPHEVSEILAKIVVSGMNDTEVMSVYDPTMGSGSLLLTVKTEYEKRFPNASQELRFFGQELNTTTYNLARMNLMMRGIAYGNMTLRNADTLEEDWPIDKKGDMEEGMTFDAVVANPPYSAKWDNNERKLKDPRFAEYGKLAPKSKADYAFILHCLYHLKRTGKMAIVLPHGVLFRGAAEGKIRQTILEKNYLDAVIGLPQNLFYGTSIPTVILVFDKNKDNRDVLFIDSSKEFVKGKNQNTLSEENIDKILQAYNDRKDIDKYAHVASFDEIKENEYNLNIPRYVDTFEEEEPVDLDALFDEMKAIDKETKQLHAELTGMLDELRGTDEESQKELDKLKEIFKLL